MSNIDKRALREAAEKATPGRIGDRVEGSIKYTCRGTDGTLVLSTDNHDDYGFVGDNSLEDELFFRLCDPVTVLALLDELEAKESTIATQQQEIRTLLNALGQSSEKRNSDLPDQKRIIGWRASDYTDETSDPELAKNWAAAIGVLPIFEGDVNTKLSAAAAGKGE
ncbi:ead/Ea22-like family protein [Enterobacter hormaechei]|uniref:ead/Ea22-like family protein n=1 Tax=Enterobacter hormaechei TaxID=158836 RepID=UPI0028758A2A|nr:ead/Ea22-like family protein [Enterobacter hormaechei]MDR9967675.1 ead/Ea22-like family protein [Enterobacter hormaechei subsp. xiangfangensis]